MSLTVAIPFGVGSAVIYGTSIVVQHRMAQQHAGDDGQASARGLLRLFRNPIFILAIGGDLIGFLLQVVALTTGPVVIIQPLVVLMLPVSLVAAYLMGGHRPTRGDAVGVLGVIGGLALFLALVGQPSVGAVPRPRVLALAVILVLVIGGVCAAVVAGANKIVRGVMYGAVGGAYFGTLAVMVDAASEQARKHGVTSLVTHSRGLVPVICLLCLALGGMVLTQMSFQVGALGATLPANIAVDPFMGVLLGVLVLHERIPRTTAHLAAYAAAVVVIVAGAIRLANPHDADATV